MKLRPYYRIPPKDWLLNSNPDVAHAKTRVEADPSLNETTVEEYVRQWVLAEIVSTYGYPPEWMGERIIVEETVQMATMEKQADISIKNERGRTFLYVETKATGVSDAEFQKAERQLQGYLSSTHTAMIGMVTDGTPKRTRCLVKKIDPNDFDYIPDLAEYTISGPRQKTRLVFELPDGTEGARSTGPRQSLTSMRTFSLSATAQFAILMGYMTTSVWMSCASFFTRKYMTREPQYSRLGARHFVFKHMAVTSRKLVRIFASSTMNRGRKILRSSRRGFRIMLDRAACSRTRSD